jgi:hypothetical protein
MSMKKTNIFYWVFTGLFSAMMLGSAIPNMISSPIAVQGMHGELGYPVYFIPFIGVAKVIGVLAILLPISARIKEWAYAGLLFDLIGATFSIIAIGKPDWIFMLLPLFLVLVLMLFITKERNSKKNLEVH